MKLIQTETVLKCLHLIYNKFLSCSNRRSVVLVRLDLFKHTHRRRVLLIRHLRWLLIDFIALFGIHYSLISF